MRFTNGIRIGLALACAHAVSRAEDASEGELAHARIVRAPVRVAAGSARAEFPIVCRSRETQRLFNQAVVALHSLDAKAADRAFYEAVVLEPDCGMAWWGLAMANIEDRVLARYYLEKAAALTARGPDRERKWVAALERYLQQGASESDRRNQMVQALSRIATENPADHEAAAFLVRQLVSNRDAGMPVPLPGAVDALIGQVLRERPDHPIGLYRPLLWENEQPQRVADAIEPVLRLLPESHRAQTVAGRIYRRLGRSSEAIACFERSLTLARKAVTTQQVGLLEVPGYVDNVDLLIAKYRVQGRVGEAVALARHLIELPSVAPVDEDKLVAATPVMKGMGAGDAANAPFASGNADATAIGQRHLLGVLAEYRRWDELAAAARSAHLESTDPEIQGLRIHALGLAEFARGKRAGVEAQSDLLAQLLVQVRTAPTSHGVNARREAVLARLQALGSDLALCRDLSNDALPPDRAPQAASAALRTVASYGRIGETDLAIASARRRIEDPAAPASAMLDLVQLLEFGGRSEEAKSELTALQRRFPHFDASPIGDGLKQPSDAAGARLAVDFSPRIAPAWALPDQHGRRIEPEQFHDSPTLLIFYRGAGCPHCIEQLQALAPLHEDFVRAGVALIGISTDTVAGLQESYSAAGADKALPFQLVSDDALNTFRDYGAIDTRTGAALHGLFLLDGRRRILWQTIGAEPFMAVKSLLAEVRRTLPLWTPPRAAIAHSAAGAQ